MFKVFIICSTLESLGPTNVIYNMLSSYYKNWKGNLEFKILTLSKEKQSSRINEFLDLGIKVHCFNIEGSINSLLNRYVIESYILKFKPDICHSYGLRADIILSYLKINDILKVSSLWNDPLQDYKMFGRCKGYILARYHLWRYKEFDAIVTCSKQNNKSIKKFGRKSAIVYTGVPEDYFKPLSYDLKNENKTAKGIPVDKKVFIFVANLIERKNSLSLIQAFMEAGQDAILLMMGDGPLMSKCKDIAKNSSNIIFLGHQSSSLEYLQISDYYISPSFAEGFPTAVLEAMSVGLKPILSSIKPHIEMTEGVIDPIYFDPNDIGDIALKIKLALSVEDNFDYRDFLIKNYTGDIMINRYTQIYGLLSGHNIKIHKQ